MARPGDRAHHAAAPAAEPGARGADRGTRARGRRLRSGQLPHQRRGAGRPEGRRARHSGGRARPDRRGLRIGLAGRHRHPGAAAHGPGHPARDSPLPPWRAHRRRPWQGRDLGWPHADRRRIPPAAHRPPHEPDRRAPAHARRARRVGLRRACDRWRQRLARERRGRHADRPAERSRPRDGANRAQRVRDALAGGGRRRSVGADQRRPGAAPRRRHRPAQGHLPPARRQPHRGLHDERALRRRSEHAVARGPAHLPRSLAHADRVDRAGCRGQRKALGRGARSPGRPRPHRRPAHRQRHRQRARRRVRGAMDGPRRLRGLDDDGRGRVVILGR